MIDRAFAGRAAALLGLSALLTLTACSKVEEWVSKKADEKIAHEIETATDDLSKKNNPSGLPSKRSKSSKKPAASASAAASSSADGVATSVPAIP